MADSPDDGLAILESKTECEACERGVDVWKHEDEDCDDGGEETSYERHAPAHPAVEGPEVPECCAVIVDFAEHTLDIFVCFGEGTDGTYTCECGAKLFEDG